MSQTFRTHLCKQLASLSPAIEVTLAGWVDVRRDLGGLIFIELRDYTGSIQLVSDPQKNQQVHETFNQLRNEYVVSVTGKISRRPDDSSNSTQQNGEIEIYPDSVKILNTSQSLPFNINQTQSLDESIRLKYRYLDIRRQNMRNNLNLRHKITRAIESKLNELDFIEVETPILTKATPEGARDFLLQVVVVYSY